MILKIAWLAMPLSSCLRASRSAQLPKKISHVGFVAAQTRRDGRVEAFRQGRANWATSMGKPSESNTRGQEDRSPLAELIHGREKVDVIVTRGAATRFGALAGTVPVIFGFSGDPVEADVVKNLAPPGGNIRCDQTGGIQDVAQSGRLGQFPYKHSLLAN